METIQLLIFVSFIFSIFLFLKYGTTKFRTQKPSPNLPPGPSKLPLIGNLHNLIGPLTHRVLHGLSLKYGPLMHLQLGELSAIVVSSPEVAKQVMQTHDINFASRPRTIGGEIMTYGCTSVVFSPYGDYWRQLRKIYSSELLSKKRVQSFRATRENVFTDLARWITSKEGSPINLTEKLYSSTFTVTSRTAFGRNSKEQETLILSIIKQGNALGTGLSIADLYPSIKLLQTLTGLRQKVERLHQKMDRICEEIIHEHKVAGNVDERLEKHEEDLVDVLLKFQDESLEIPLTTDNIKAVLIEVIAAGSETAGTTMDWAMAEMIRNPRILKKAQDEVRQVFDGKGSCVDESNINELKYLKSVIKETLRLHATVPLLIPKLCSQTCEINGYEIPANTKILVNAWAINKDPKYWENAENFQPERFLDSSVDYTSRGNCFEYIPFGAGRRICPGISFGVANIELALAMLLYHFDWNLPVGMKHEEVDMTERFGMSLTRENDLYLVPVIKRPLPS